MAFQSLERYPKCASVNKIQPDNTVNPEIVKELSNNYRTLPAFEKSLYEHSRMRYYSMQNNEKLACRWAEYKRAIEERTFAPFQFPNRRDLHFYMNTIRYVPSQSLHNTSTFRLQLKPGPGVDLKGQTPIPQEMLMKRGSIGKEEHHKQKKVDKRKGKAK